MATKVLPGGGLAVKVIGSRETKRRMAEFPVLVQRKVMRLAVAAGARPVAAEMRGRLQRISAASKRHEGIGTAARSVAVKTASKKSDPNVAYAIVGARRGYQEFASLRFGTSGRRAGAIRSIVSFRVGRNRRGTRFNVSGPRDIKKFSPAMRAARLRPTKGMQNNKRVPSKYFHLLEKGRHKTPPIWRGWHFAQRTANRLRGMVQLIMRRQIVIGIQREWLKGRRVA